MVSVLERVNEMVDRRYRGRKLILTGGVAAMWQMAVDDLRRRGAGPFLVLHTGAGTGNGPAGDDVTLVDTGVAVPAEDLLTEFRVWEAIAADPPATVTEAMAAFDPEGDALVLTGPPAAIDRIGDRPIHGGRLPEWVALEDKTLVDDMLDRAGVTRSPSTVVDVALAAGVAARFDDGLGTVWSGDAREGFNGGAARVRWVTDETSAREATAFFSLHHDRVRVSPFLEGIPCSIHGLVGSSGMAVLRPCEMLVYRAPEKTFVYGGVSTAWDPAPQDREEMRDAARRVGTLLRDEVDFRGTFTLDGVMTADGFRPTEVNPRFGGGIARIAGRVESLPLVELHRELIADPVLDLDFSELEQLVLAEADAVEGRAASSWLFLPDRLESTSRWRFVLGPDDEPELVEDGQSAVELTAGPSAVGSMLRVDMAEVFGRPGPSLAPLAVRVLGAAGRLSGVEVPELEAARSVR